MSSANSAAANTVTDSSLARERLWELIKGIRIGMFTTRSKNGHLVSRPVTTMNKNLTDDSSLWFFMAHDGEPVADVSQWPYVSVTYADSHSDSYVSVTGLAELVEDNAKKQQLWTKLAEAWFPGGPGDLNLALVQVKIVNAHYWDIRENKLVQLFYMAKAAMSGTPPTNLGEQAEIRIRG
jgi:general stress protein 26